MDIMYCGYFVCFFFDRCIGFVFGQIVVGSYCLDGGNKN